MLVTLMVYISSLITGAPNKLNIGYCAYIVLREEMQDRSSEKLIMI
jgi:hypothetical protein